MQLLTTIDRVLAGSGTRTISLLSNRQLIEMRWDRMVVQLRATDLLVLDRTLRAWLWGEYDEASETNGDDASCPDAERPGWQLLPYDCTQPYILSLNHQCILIREQEVVGFCALVADAVAQLPRRTVRWVELDVQLLPLSQAASVPASQAIARASSACRADAASGIMGLACLCPN